MFLPSAVGRELVRWVKVTRNQQGRASFAVAIVFERLTFVLVLLLCGSIPLFMYRSIPEITVLRMKLQPWLIAALVVTAVLLSFYVSTTVRSIAKSTAENLFKRHSDRLNLVALVDSFTLHNMKAAAYAGVVGLSFVWQIFYIGRLFTLIKAAALPLNLIDIVWMGSLVLLLQTLPISFAGIGLREGAYAYLFTLYKLPPEKGVLVGILFFSQMLIMAFIGGIFELLDQ
jgi:uncharacterized membrane protein YbhN (UPF0104 family)